MAKQKRAKANDLFCLNLKRLMAAKRVTQEDLAKRICCHQAYVSNLVTGKKGVSLARIDEISLELDCPVHEFFIEPVDSAPKKRKSKS